VPEPSDIFASAEWYDRTIDWSARLTRELPVLRDVVGSPGAGGLIDAGCGTGRHTLALAQLGYSVCGIDASAEMIGQAESFCQGASVEVGPRFFASTYADMISKVGEQNDAVICLGNALAAAGTRGAVETAIGAFGQCLRPAGKLFLQILNFAAMRQETPCVRGPRVATVAGREYVSCRHFHFAGDAADVTNVTVWKEKTWRMHSRCGTLFPLELPDLSTWCESASLQVDALWGSYAREPFDRSRSNDLIVVATRR